MPEATTRGDESHDQEPTGELPPGFEGVDPADLRALADAGWGEGDDGDHHVPGDFLALWVAGEAKQAGLL
jgi:hypothetical protein